MTRSILGRAALALASLSIALSPAAAQITASSITVKDGVGGSQVLGTGTAGGKQFYGFFAIDASGNVFPAMQNCVVIADGTDAAYTAGATGSACTITTKGRLRVGLSSAALIGGLAAGYSDLAGAIDPSGNQQAHKVNGNGDLQVSNRAGIFYTGATGSGSALAASATFTGATRDSGVAAGTPHPFAYFTAFFNADQAGTAFIDCSNDGSTWYACTSAAAGALAANTPVFLTVPVLARYHRARVVNGSTAEGSLYVNSGYTGA